MRTGLALMGLGFVVARFGLFLREIALAGGLSRFSRPDATKMGLSPLPSLAAPVHAPHWSLWIGVGLIALGVIATLLASWEYFRFVRLSNRNQPYRPRTAVLSIAAAVILGLLGMVMAVYLVMTGA
jgi:putative membrane protein